MPTYIEREAAESAIFNAKWWDNADEGIAQDFIQNLPVADVMPIIRCRDCVYYRAQVIWGGNPYLYVCCRTNGYSPNADHYCAWGERSNEPFEKRLTATASRRDEDETYVTD